MCMDKAELVAPLIFLIFPMYFCVSSVKVQSVQKAEFST